MTLDARDLTRGLSHLEKEQAPYAAARALTDTAWTAARGLGDHMKTVFDQPTAFTRNAFRAQGATKSKLEATVLPKDRQGGRHYLFAQEDGGPRPQTGIEKLLARNVAFEGVLQTVIPAQDARLTKAGNLSPGQLQQVLSGVGAQRDRTSNTTAASRRRRPSRDVFFVPRAGLAPGVFARSPSGRLKMILAFTDRVARYNPRLGFEDYVIEVMADEFPEAFAKWLDRAMRSRK